MASERRQRKEGGKRKGTGDSPRPAPTAEVSKKVSRASASSSSARRGTGGAGQNPSIVIVGAGRLGTALARALAARGYEIAAMTSRDSGHARRAVKLSGSRALALTTDRLSELPPADLLLITTPDDAIAETAARLARLLDAPARRGRVALHASGALSSLELSPLGERGFAIGSMHPLVAVSDAEGGVASFREAHFCVEGDARAVRLARRLARDLGGHSFSISAQDKALYHAAAVMASGHAVALFDIAARLLADCGVAERRAREILLPLLRSTHENLSRQPPARALTGTFARADASTVRKHLSAFAEHEDGAVREVYVLLGLRSLALATETRADEAAVEEIARLLKMGARVRS